MGKHKLTFQESTIGQIVICTARRLLSLSQLWNSGIIPLPTNGHSTESISAQRIPLECEGGALTLPVSGKYYFSKLTEATMEQDND